MANSSSSFDNIKNEIEYVFNSLIVQLEKRKCHLLQILSNIQDKYESLETSRLKKIEDLERAQESEGQISLRQNENVSILEEIASVYRNRIAKLEQPTPLPNLTFNNLHLAQLQSMVRRFGEVLECVPIDYSCKQTAKITTGKMGKGKGEFNGPKGIANDENKKQIFVADRDNSRIQAFTHEGEFVSEFGRSELKSPYGVAVTEDHLFVTDTFHHAVFRYNSSHPFELVSRAGGKGNSDGQLNRPHGLTVDKSGDVYIAEYWNYRVSIFTKNLYYIRAIGKGILVYPKDVKMTRNTIVVLDCSALCIHFFTLQGELLSSCITQGYQSHCDVYEPLFFCLDESGNMIISDKHAIKIFSNSGDLLQTIGEKGKDKGQLAKPKGVCITKSGILFVTCLNPKCALQSF